VDLANPPANYVPKVWVEGREGSNLYDDLTAAGMVSERLSLLAAYTKNKDIFRCPGDRELWTVNGKTVRRPRSFGMNAYVGWVGDPWHEMPDARRYKIQSKTTDARNASTGFIFGEINPNSICRPMFGINITQEITMASDQTSRLWTGMPKRIVGRTASLTIPSRHLPTGTITREIQPAPVARVIWCGSSNMLRLRSRAARPAG
jgi:hypothetical protein